MQKVHKLKKHLQIFDFSLHNTQQQSQSFKLFLTYLHKMHYEILHLTQKINFPSFFEGAKHFGQKQKH